MGWTRVLGTLGLGLGFATPAWAQDAEPAEDATSAQPIAMEPAATPAEEGKFALGLRLGYGLPLGATAKNDDGSSNELSDIVSGQFPIWLDLGYMVTPNVMLGLYGQYGFASLTGELKSLCDEGSAQGVNCSVADIRFGVQGQYHISPAEQVDPWLGLGVGYEMLKFNVSDSSEEDTLTYNGFEFANLQGGVDFKAMPNFGLGPFVSLSLGQYSSGSISGPASSQISGGDIRHKALHEWLTFGVRGAFTL